MITFLYSTFNNNESKQPKPCQLLEGTSFLVVAVVSFPVKKVGRVVNFVCERQWSTRR